MVHALAWAYCYILRYKVFLTTSIRRIGIQHHAFLLDFLLRCWGGKEVAPDTDLGFVL